MPALGGSCAGVGGRCAQKGQAALEALLLEVFEPFVDAPESLLEELESLLAVLESPDDEPDLDFSDSRARAFEP